MHKKNHAPMQSSARNLSEQQTVRYTGKVTSQHGVNFFMESSAGRSDIFIPQDAIHGCIEIGDFVTAIVEKNDVGTCKWKAISVSTNSKHTHESGGTCAC